MIGERILLAPSVLSSGACEPPAIRLSRAKQPSDWSAIPVGVAEGDETLLPFVPQDQSHTAETLQQGQPPDALEARVVTQYQRQPVTGNSTAKMVDVVNADVGGEPAQNSR